MTSFIHNTYRSALKNRENLNILVFSSNGIFESMLATAFPEHTFYCLFPEQHWIISLIDKPDNMVVMVGQQNTIPLYTNIDAVIANDRLDGFDTCYNLAHSFHIPLISVEHICVPILMRREDIELINTTRVSSTSISTNKCISESWGRQDDIIIPYNLPELLIKKVIKKDQVLIIGDFQALDITFIANVVKNIPMDVKIYGESPGLSSPPETWQVLLDDMCESSIFLSLSSDAQPPLYMLYAMSAGCAIVANNTFFNTTILSESEGGIVGNSPEEIKKNIYALCNNQQGIQDMGSKSIEYIDKVYDPHMFVSEWQKIFNQIKNFVYVR